MPDRHSLLRVMQPARDRVGPDALARTMRAYITVLVGAVVALAVVAELLVRSSRGVWAGGWTGVAVVAALALVAAVAERRRVSLGGSVESSISLLPTVFAAVVFGPVAALVVAAVSYLHELGGIRPKWAVFTCTRAIGGAAAGIAAGFAVRIGPNPHSLGATSLATAAAIVCAAGADLGFGALTYRLRRLGPPREFVVEVAPPLLLSMPLYAPLVLGLALAYDRVSPLVVPLFLIPALAAQRLFVLYQSERDLNRKVVATHHRLEAAHESFVNALVATLDARDPYTAGHSNAVAGYACDIAEAMGLDEQQQRLAERCGLLHDLGKTGIAPAVLEKPGALTLTERREMERHPVIGADILARIDDNHELATIVRHHHERIDGRGYPDGLSGDDIPLISRILAVADSYNAMTSDRPYRDAMPTHVARMRLAQAAGSQLDVAAVAAFERVLATADEDYRKARGERFAAEPIVADELIEAATPLLRLVSSG